MFRGRQQPLFQSRLLSHIIPSFFYQPNKVFRGLLTPIPVSLLLLLLLLGFFAADPFLNLITGGVSLPLIECLPCALQWNLDVTMLFVSRKNVAMARFTVISTLYLHTVQHNFGEHTNMVIPRSIAMSRFHCTTTSILKGRWHCRIMSLKKETAHTRREGHHFNELGKEKETRQTN